MKKNPLRILDYSVTKDWDLEKAAEYEKNITDAIRFTEMRGKPLTIEYIDENLNVISTLKFKGNEKKYLEYESKINNLVELMKKESK